MQTRLSFSFFTLPLPALFLPPLHPLFPLSLSFLRGFSNLASLACALFCFFSSLSPVSLARERKCCALSGKATRNPPVIGTSIGRSRTTCPTPPTPASAHHWLLFRTPVFAADYIRVRLRACVVRACYACTRAQNVRACSLARFLVRLSSSLLPFALGSRQSRAHRNARSCEHVCTNMRVLAHVSVLGLQKSTGCFWRTILQSLSVLGNTSLSDGKLRF